MKRFTIAAVTLAALTFVPAASAGATARVDAAAAGNVAKVKMVDGLAFRPATITISRGTTVKWVNRDNVTHTSTSSRWDSGNVAPGTSFRHRFRRAGTFNYRCSIHSSMTGTVVVN